MASVPLIPTRARNARSVSVATSDNVGQATITHENLGAPARAFRIGTSRILVLGGSSRCCHSSLAGEVRKCL